MSGIIFLCEGQNSTCSYWQQCVAISFKADLENALKSWVLNSVFHPNLMNMLLKKQSGWEGIINHTWISVSDMLLWKDPN